MTEWRYIRVYEGDCGFCRVCDDLVASWNFENGGWKDICKDCLDWLREADTETEERS